MNSVTSTLAIEQSFVPFALALTRVSSFVMAAPMFGRGTVPNLVKTGLCLSLSLLLLPRYEQTLLMQVTVEGKYLALAILMECAVGVALGYLIRLLILPTRIAGSYIGQELGFHLGQVVDPTTGGATNEVNLLFDALGLVVFWVSNTHHVALRILALSVRSLRGEREFVQSVAFVAGELLSSAHELGIMMVSPLASLLFLTLLYLGVAMRAWPQLTLFSFGMSARLLLGLCAFVLLLPLMIFNMEQVFHSLGELLEDWVRVRP